MFEFIDCYGVNYGDTEAEIQKKKDELELHVRSLMRGIAEYPEKIQVTYYRYRKAQACEFTFAAERDSFYGLECLLTMKAGVRLDNHCVFGVTQYNTTEYYWFEDDRVYCGKKIAMVA